MSYITYSNKVGQTNTWFTKESEILQVMSRKQSLRQKKTSEAEKSEFEEITPDNTQKCIIMWHEGTVLSRTKFFVYFIYWK